MQPFSSGVGDYNLFSRAGPPMASCTELHQSRRSEGELLLVLCADQWTDIWFNCKFYTGASGPSSSCAFKPLIAAESPSRLMERLCFYFHYWIMAQSQGHGHFSTQNHVSASMPWNVAICIPNMVIFHIWYCNKIFTHFSSCSRHLMK